MPSSDSIIGTGEFQDPDRESGHLLATWLQRSGINSRTILEELTRGNSCIGLIGQKTFRQWVNDGETARRVSGETPDIRGSRVVCLLRWVVNEHQHRRNPVIFLDEVRAFINLYPDIPVKYRLQLYRILHDLEFDAGQRKPDLFTGGNWQKRYAEWSVYAFILDRYWCIRASNCYEMALMGYEEKDMCTWMWWHRLIASADRKPKLSATSPIHAIRGPYAEAYYANQMKRFRRATDPYLAMGDPRFLSLLEILNGTPGFKDAWQAAEIKPGDDSDLSVGIPVPFFRRDGTLLWMLEVSTPIPDTDGYQMILWSPLNNETDEYLSEIRQWADEPGRYHRKAYLIEEFKDYFGEKERYAFDIG